MLTYTKEELIAKIEEETANIKRLEASYPTYVQDGGRYSQENRAWEIHHTEVRDAYWRRRIAQDRLDGTSEDVIAKTTATVY